MLFALRALFKLHLLFTFGVSYFALFAFGVIRFGYIEYSRPQGK